VNKQIAFLICWLALLLTACGGGTTPEPSVTEATAVPPPRLGRFTSVGEPIPKDLTPTTEIVQNCGGTSESIVKHPSLAVTMGDEIVPLMLARRGFTSF